MQGQLRNRGKLTDVAGSSVLNEPDGIIHGELSMRAGAFNIQRRFIYNRGSPLLNMHPLQTIVPGIRLFLPSSFFFFFSGYT